MQKLIIRKLKDKDLQELLNLYNEYDKSTPTLASLQQIKEKWTEIKKDQKIIYYVGVIRETIVTTCFLTIIPQFTREGMNYGFIENVITKKSHRRQGLATQLLQYVLNEAWNRNCYQVLLLSGNKTQEAIGLYTKVGFDKDRKNGFVALRKGIR